MKLLVFVPLIGDRWWYSGMFIHFYLNGLNAKDGNTFLNGLVTPLRHQVTKKTSKRPAVSEPLRVPRLTFLSGESDKKTEKYIILTFFRTIRWTDRITEQQSCTNGSWFTKPFLFFQLNESYRSICNFLLMIKGTQPSLSAVIEFFQCNSFVVQREHFFKTKLLASHWAVKERIKGFFSFFFFHYEC